ncbi:MAG: NFACT family protein [Lachnospiraceae bacterium]|nr:NFACT family protein [Ruminococcus sp.]MCM1276402.1 NFACT family protein [Lachnospiraceae bacterium]
MSLDGALLHCIKQELTGLIGARVDKIYQPSREEIVLTLRQLGGGDRSRKALIFSANGGSARVNLTGAEFENPQSPPMFCMLLRKHLGGGKLVGIRQDGLERILYFDFECTNEIGDIVVNTVVSEIMGRHSNIIVVRDGRVVDSIKRVTDEVSSVRRVLPNIVYETPPRAERLNLLETSSEEILRALVGRADRLAKALPEVLEGVSPIFARECAFRAGGDVDLPCNELVGERRGRFAAFIDKARAALNGAAEYTMLTDETGRKRDFCFVGVGQYGSAMSISRFNTANALVDDFFSSAGKAERLKQRAKDLLKTVNTAYERVSRKLELQKKELAECAEREVFRVCGDLINANIYQLEKGMTACVLDDFYTGEKREIKLDARLSPSQNAQKYYAEYRKLDTAEKVLTELIKKGADDLIYLDSVLDCISRNEDERELAEIRRELREQGFIKGRGEKPDDKRKKLSEPLKFRSTEGFEILVGKNNRQNDLLTLKTARATDIWLHTKDIAGSHVIIKTDGKTPSERTIFEAAQLAAFHSKGRSGSGVPVDYTAVKFVKKPAGAKPGMVIFTNNKTLYVTPDEGVVEKLRER